MNQPTLRAFIIDDEEEAINSLLILTQDIDNLEISGTATDPEKSIRMCLKIKPDIVFLDINMPGKDGFRVLQELHDHHFFPYAIFTTAWDNYTLKALKSGALDYLLKPIDKADLLTAIKKAKDDRNSHSIELRLELLERAIRNHRKLRFNTRSGFILIHPEDIFYIEADANYSEIYFSTNQREVVSMNLGLIESMLPEEFIRISRSVIINSTYLTRLSGVSRKCSLSKNNVEKEFCIPEKQMKELKLKIGNSPF